MKGSLEVLVGGESLGTTVTAATLDTVPLVVQVVYGIAGLTPSDDVPDGAAAAWGGQTDDGRGVTVILWPERPLDATALGQALAAVLAEAAAEAP